MSNNEVKPGKSDQPKLVIIDDEENILLSLRSLFRKEKCSIHVFSSGAEALEFLKTNDVDVIITDMRMPELNGSQVLERSAVICPNAIKIVISGYEDKSVILNAISQGLASHYILKPWDDEQFRSIVGECLIFQKALKQKKLQEVLISFKNLPSPPRLHLKLKEMLQKDMMSQKEIALEIEKNPALVAKLLRMSNSIFYGPRKPVTNVFDAITFIGTEFVLSTILLFESFDNLCINATSNAAKMVEEIRIKSIMRAQTAREISLLWSEKIDPHEAYITAMMLDIGLILRFCSDQEKFERFIRNYNSSGKNLFSIDKELYSATHDEVGEALLTYWNFSPSIITAVANHHRYTSNHSLTTVVQIADKIILENDSYPHDPLIDEAAKEWEAKLKEILISIKNPEQY